MYLQIFDVGWNFWEKDLLFAHINNLTICSGKIANVSPLQTPQ